MASASSPSTSNGNGGARHGAGPSESNWNVVDPGPSQTLNGWDDPVDGWELQPSYYNNNSNNPYNGDNILNNNNGKASWETMSSSSGSFTKVKSRKGAGSVSSAYSESRRGGGQRQGPNRNNSNNGNPNANPNANANSDRTSPRQQQGGGGGGSRGSRGRGKSFNGGRGGAAAAKGFAWGQSQNARQYEDYGVPVGRAWETAAAGNGVNGSPENAWQLVGSTKSRNGSECSSRSAPGGVNNNNNNNNNNSNPNYAKAWHQGARATSTQLVSAGSSGNLLPQGGEGGNAEAYEYPASPYSDSQCSDLDHVDDDSDDAFFSDDSYTQETHEEQKKIKWFRDFFQDLDGMTDGQCTEHDRQWHCPACKGGPGAIDWFRGLVPLATHARTMRSRRVKLHRKFAEVLEEELRIRRSGAGPGVDGGATSQLAFGKWKGLSEETEVQQQQLVIWPPIVVIQNTQLEQDDEGRWIGMGNRELVDMFKDYNPLKPRHAYGPQGHRGMSLLIFSDSPAGYHDAVRLGNHFVKLRRGRDDWNRPSKLMFRPGGNRILYGYLAVKEDLDIFNKHSRGKTLVRYDVRRLQEVVVEPMQRMEQENQQMQSLQSEHNTLKKTVSKTSKNLQLREEELQVLRERAEKQHSENKRHLADMEEFFQTESAQWADEVASKDTELQKLRDDFDKIYWSRCQELNAQRSNLPDDQEQQDLMADDIQQKTKKVEGSLLEAQDFENKLKELEQKHHERRVQFQKQQHEAALAFEQQIKTERTEFLHSFEKQMKIR